MRRRLSLSARAGLAAVGLIAAACGPQQVPATVPGRDIAAEIDTLVRRGCYRCFETAQRLCGEHGCDSTTAAQISLLVRLRQKELGLPYDGASTVSDPPSSNEISTLADAVEAVPSRTLTSADVQPAEYQAVEALRPKVLALKPTTPASTYIVRSFLCAFTYGAEAEPLRHVSKTDSPLQRYGSATCGSLDIEALEQLQRDDADFREIDGLLGDAALRDRRLRRADEHYSRALDAFPDWSHVRLSLAGVASARRQLPRSIDLYRRVLAAVPGAPAASLGLGIALSYDAQYAAARELFDTVLATSSWNLGDAWYWRAWNGLKLNDLDSARHDIAEAKRLDSSLRVSKLAGTIALHRHEYPQAREDLLAALALDPGECEVTFLLGAVEQGDAHAALARERYGAARDCFGQTIASLEPRLQSGVDAADEDAMGRREELQMEVTDAKRWRSRAEELMTALVEKHGH